MPNTQPIEIRVSLDRSGSMAGWHKPVVDGVNAYIKKVQDDPVGRDATLKLVQWDSLGFDIMRNGKSKVLDVLKQEEYAPRALTPLHDAVMSSLEDGVVVGTKYVLVIFTDGEENYSKKYRDIGAVKAKIEQRLKEGWTVIFLGANIDAWKTAEAMGIPAATTMNVHVQGRNQPPQQPRSAWRRVADTFTGGGGGSVSPVVLGLTAAAGLGLAYMLLRPGTAAAAQPAFSDADRNAAMGVDGVTTTWQDAVAADVAGFDEPFNSMFDLPNDLQQEHSVLPTDFDPSLGSMDSNGEQLGGFDTDEMVTSQDEVPLAQDAAGEHSSSSDQSYSSSDEGRLQDGRSSGWDAPTRQSDYTPSEPSNYSSPSGGGGDYSGDGGGGGGGGGDS